MGDKSGIEWTDATWNPTTGCDRVSPGCANCYALTMAARLKAAGVAAYQRDGDPKTSGPGFGLTLHDDRLDMPLRWKRPRRVFVNSMSDLFHPDVLDTFIDRVFAVMALADQHVFQVLTKRPERMRAYMTGDEHHDIGFRRDTRAWVEDAARNLRPRYVMDTWPLPNVWLGTSVENARWRTRIDDLRQTPAAVRFLSCEPLLGPLTLNALDAYDREDYPRIEPALASRPGLDLSGIHWVIIGGESGPGARPMDADWVRGIVASSRAQGAAPFVKQMGDAWSRTTLGYPSHGGDITTFPPDLRIREWPDGSRQDASRGFRIEP